MDRRNFLKVVGAAGLGSVLARCEGKDGLQEPNAAANQKPKPAQVPRRKLGKTGVKVPVLSLGTMFNLIDTQVLLHSALKYGINYWDTSNIYAGGTSELGIGKFLKSNPDRRKDLFIVTKASRARTVEEIEQRLQLSLKRMNTNYIDLYYAPHGASDPKELTDELAKWAESAKKRKLIRFFGFSTHKNMAQCLLAASKLDWIDVIMPLYNFRVAQDPAMQDAIEACHQAKIGLVAMKTTGKTTIRRFRVGIETEADRKMVGHFLERGLTPEQAGIKFALADKRISSACVQMENTALLKQNVAIVLDETALSEQDKQILAEYARATCSGYCAGCAHICQAAVPQMPYISDVMRYLMYYNSYGDRDRARQLFAQLPQAVRRRLLQIDYRPAEARCPQRMPIGELIAEAVAKLA